MAMTPIKVRGKRASVQRESSKNSNDSFLNPCLKGKRPLSPASHFPTPSAKLSRHTNTLSEHSGKHARVAAPLEQLPTEILETIFLHHLNISLPQASPIIGNKLASKHVKTQLVLRVCSSGRRNAYPCEQAALFPSMTDHAEAQSTILRLRWMTLTFIRQLIPDYITKTLVRELSERGLQWLGKGPLVTKETESTIRQYLEGSRVLSFTKTIHDPTTFGTLSWRIENPPRIVRISFGLHDGLVTIEERRIHGLEKPAQHVRSLSAERDQWRIFCGINGCKVPGKLLQGPWTINKCDLLGMLIRGNATVDWVGTTNGEIAEKGLMQALREGNAYATRLLVTRAGPGEPLGLWGLPCSHDSSFIENLSCGPWPREDVFQVDSLHLGGVGVVPRTKHLRTAVLEAGCREDVVETLLMAKDTNIDFEDQVVLVWAVEKNILRDERGPWLLSMLSEARRSRLQGLQHEALSMQRTTPARRN